MPGFLDRFKKPQAQQAAPAPAAAAPAPAAAAPAPVPAAGGMDMFGGMSIGGTAAKSPAPVAAAPAAAAEASAFDFVNDGAAPAAAVAAPAAEASAFSFLSESDAAPATPVPAPVAAAAPLSGVAAAAARRAEAAEAARRQSASAFAFFGESAGDPTLTLESSVAADTAAAQAAAAAAAAPVPAAGATDMFGGMSLSPVATASKSIVAGVGAMAAAAPAVVDPAVAAAAAAERAAKVKADAAAAEAARLAAEEAAAAALSHDKKLAHMQESLTTSQTKFWRESTAVSVKHNALHAQQTQLLFDRTAARAQLEGLEAEQAAAIEAEEYEKADSLNAQLEQCRANIAQLAGRAKAAADGFEALHAQRVEAATAMVTSTSKMHERFLNLQDQVDDERTIFVRRETARQHEAEDRLTADLERLERITQHVDADLARIGTEEAEIEASILEQTKDSEADRIRLELHEEGLVADIAALQKQIADKEAELSLCRGDLTTTRATIAKAREGHERQLKRVAEKRARVLKEQKEAAADGDQCAERKRQLAQDAADKEKKEYEYKSLAWSVEAALAHVSATKQRFVKDCARRDEWLALEKDATEASALLRRNVSTAQNRINEAKSRTGILDAEVLQHKATIANIDGKMPGLQAEKQVAVSKRNFKEAGRVSKDIKDLEASKQASEDALVQLKASENECYDAIASAEKTLQKADDESAASEQKFDEKRVVIMARERQALRSWMLVVEQQQRSVVDTTDTTAITTSLTTEVEHMTALIDAIVSKHCFPPSLIEPYDTPDEPEPEPAPLEPPTRKNTVAEAKAPVLADAEPPAADAAADVAPVSVDDVAAVVKTEAPAASEPEPPAAAAAAAAAAEPVAETPAAAVPAVEEAAMPEPAAAEAVADTATTTAATPTAAAETASADAVVDTPAAAAAAVASTENAPVAVAAAEPVAAPAAEDAATVTAAAAAPVAATEPASVPETQAPVAEPAAAAAAEPLAVATDAPSAFDFVADTTPPGGAAAASVPASPSASAFDFVDDATPTTPVAAAPEPTPTPTSPPPMSAEDVAALKRKRDELEMQIQALEASIVTATGDDDFDKAEKLQNQLDGTQAHLTVVTSKLHVAELGL